MRAKSTKVGFDLFVGPQPSHPTREMWPWIDGMQKKAWGICCSSVFVFVNLNVNNRLRSKRITADTHIEQWTIVVSWCNFSTAGRVVKVKDSEVFELHKKIMVIPHPQCWAKTGFARIRFLCGLGACVSGFREGADWSRKCIDMLCQTLMQTKQNLCLHDSSPICYRLSYIVFNYQNRRPHFDPLQSQNLRWLLLRFGERATTAIHRFPLNVSQDHLDRWCGVEKSVGSINIPCDDIYSRQSMMNHRNHR